MSLLTRREFSKFAIASGLAAKAWCAAPARFGGVDDVLRRAVTEDGVPAVVGMAADRERIIYSGAFGSRDSFSKLKVGTDSIFAIASMTKPITAVAAMQLFERGKLKLDAEAALYLPILEDVRVLEGFDPQGKPLLRKPVRAITVRHLLTHTSGFGYETWDANLLRYDTALGVSDGEATPTPLSFDPGSAWEYGTSYDWLGRIIESISAMDLEKYFQTEILAPLGMKDTSYNLRDFDRYVSRSQRAADGQLHENSRKAPRQKKTFNGGGGIFCTPQDYLRFAQFILNHGRAGKTQLLQSKTIETMTSNQIGSLRMNTLQTAQPEDAADFTFSRDDKFGFGFLVQMAAGPGGRNKGSASWAGLLNTFFWIDPRRGIAAVVFMQYLPFLDPAAVRLLHDFERAVYTDL